MNSWNDVKIISTMKEHCRLGTGGGLFRLAALLLLCALLGGNAFCQNDFDLFAYSTDPNGFPLNPGWGWQTDAAWQAQQTNTPLTAKNVTDLLNAFQWPMVLSSGPQPASLLPFATFHPTYDLYHGVIPLEWPGDGLLCQWTPWRDNEIETGHMNFLEATFTGVLTGPTDHSTGFLHDGDVDDIFLDTSNTVVRNFGINNGGLFPGGPGAVGPSPLLGLEFNYDETLHYYNQPTSVFGSVFKNYWANFGDWIDSQPDLARNMIDSHEATVVGLFGLDMVHPPARPEIHPVHAIAIRENNIDPGVPEQDDVWAFFARASGHEGKCSSNYHTLNTAGITIELAPPFEYRDAARLPLPGVTATLVSSKAWFVIPTGDEIPIITNLVLSSGASGTFLTLIIPEFNLGDPTRTSGDYIPNAVYGEILLHWSQPSDNIILNLPPPPTSAHHSTTLNSEPEEMETKIWNMISPVQQGIAGRMFKTLLPPPPAVNTRAASVVFTKTPPPPPPRVVPTLIDSLNRTAPKRNLVGLQAGCIATKGDIPLLPGACTQFQPVTTLTAVGANGGPVSPQANGWYAGPLFILSQATSHSGFPIVDTILTLWPSGQKITVPQGSTVPVRIPEGFIVVSYQSRDSLGNMEELRSEGFRIGHGPPKL